MKNGGRPTRCDPAGAEAEDIQHGDNGDTGSDYNRRRDCDASNHGGVLFGELCDLSNLAFL